MEVKKMCISKINFAKISFSMKLSEHRLSLFEKEIFRPIFQSHYHLFSDANLT